MCSALHRVRVATTEELKRGRGCLNGPWVCPWRQAICIILYNRKELYDVPNRRGTNQRLSNAMQMPCAISSQIYAVLVNVFCLCAYSLIISEQLTS